MKWQAVTTIVRDVLSMGLGVFIGVNEELSGAHNLYQLTFAFLLLGGPPAYALVQAIRSVPVAPPAPPTGREEPAPTTGPSSPSA